MKNNAGKLQPTSFMSSLYILSMWILCNFLYLISPVLRLLCVLRCRKWPNSTTNTEQQSPYFSNVFCCTDFDKIYKILF
jgi:hypothetical protein